MKISGLEFAFNDLEEKVHIDVAQKNTRWWLLEGKRVELVLCDGEKVKKYWRTKTDDEFEKIYPDGLKQYWNSESEQHKYIKGQLLQKKILQISNNIVIKAHSVKDEVWFDSINKRPDVVFYDEDENIMCLIEIYYSNKKSSEDIKKLSQLNVPIFEINISNYELESRDKKNKPTVNLIFNPERAGEISDIKKQIKDIELEVKEKDRICRNERKNIEYIERDNKYTTQEIIRFTDKIRWIENQVQSGGIEDIARIRGRIRVEDRRQYDFTKEIREVKSKIEEEEAQRQLERQSMWAERWDVSKQNPLF